VGEAPTSEGDVPGPEVRVEGPDGAALSRAYLDWGKDADLAVGKATGTPDTVPAVTREAGSQTGGVTQPGEKGEVRGGGSAPTSPRPRLLWLLGAIAAVVIVLDVVTKVIVVARLTGRAPVVLVPRILDLELTRNPGAAFSVGTGLTAIYTILAIVVVLVVARTARRLASTGWAIALGGIIGGAIGNLLDRIFRAPGPFRGYVVDWIHLTHWPIFNVADSAISCGAVLAVVLSAMGIGLDGRRAGRDAPRGGGAAPSGGPTAGGGTGATADDVATVPAEGTTPAEPAGRE
jgi:signal peptidase II